MKEFIIEQIDDLGEVAEEIVGLLGSRKVVALIGEIGAGKTTLVQKIGERLGAVDVISSPTFNIIHSYLTTGGGYFHHMDLYRLRTVEEALQTGLEEYLTGGEPVFIEWPELITPYLPEETLFVRLEHLTDNARKIVLL